MSTYAPTTHFDSIPCSANSFPLTLLADPRPLNPVVSIFYKNTGGRGGGRGVASPLQFFEPFQPSEFTERFLVTEACGPTKPPLLYWNLNVSPRTVTKLQISIVQYLNTAPLVWGFTNGPLRGKYDLSFTVPSLCAEALRNGAADIAIIPAIEYQRIDDLVILPDMAIASQNQVRILLLISKKPIEAARSIALDRSSRSTQALTKILCDRKWKIAPEFLEMPPDAGAMLQRADAALLIGDPALRLSIEIAASAKRGASGEQICPAD